jgi:DNA-binding NtrC family response regulator
VELLSAYSWPGNVRELENAIERAVVISAGKTVQPDDFPEHIRAASKNGRTTNDPEADAFSPGATDFEGNMSALEKRLLIDALKTHQTTRKAAKSLGISQSTVVRKMKRYGISATSQ